MIVLIGGPIQILIANKSASLVVRRVVVQRHEPAVVGRVIDPIGTRIDSNHGNRVGTVRSEDVDRLIIVHSLLEDPQRSQ
jgi:hypothetical protein